MMKKQKQKLIKTRKKDKEENEKETYKLWRIRKTVMQLCRDRGYKVSQDEIDLTLNEFKIRYGENPSEGSDLSDSSTDESDSSTDEDDPTNKMDISQNEIAQTAEKFKLRFGAKPPNRNKLHVAVAYEDDPTNKMDVYFLKRPRLSLKLVKSIFAVLRKRHVFRAIVITQEKLTYLPKGILTSEPPYILEHFRESQLIFNVTEHVSVPKHIALTAEEQRTLFQRYGLTKKQLLPIKVGDPVCKYFGWTRGQVIKIIRVSESVPKYVAYRVVTK